MFQLSKRFLPLFRIIKKYALQMERKRQEEGNHKVNMNRSAVSNIIITLYGGASM
jgi:hypothetical protein